MATPIKEYEHYCKLKKVVENALRDTEDGQ